MSDFNQNDNQNEDQPTEDKQQTTQNYYEDSYQQPVNYNQQYQTYQNVEPEKKSSGMAIASMVLGIISVIISCVFYLALPLAIVGLVLGIISIRSRKGGKGMAIAGIVMCSITTLIAILLIVSCMAFVNEGGYDIQSILDSINEYSSY